MSHKESNDLDREQYELMTKIPGEDDLCDIADSAYAAAIYHGDFIGDAQSVSNTTIPEDCMDIELLGRELESLRAMPEPLNIFELAKQRDIDAEMDRVARFYAREVV